MHRVLSPLRSLALLTAFSFVWTAAPFAQRGGGASAGEAAAGKGGAALSVGPYDAVANWPSVSWPRQGFIWGSQAGIFPSRPTGSSWRAAGS